MSTSGKEAQRTTKVTTVVPVNKKPVTERRAASGPVMVLDLIKSTLQSELLPNNKGCALLDKEGRVQGYRAEFAIQGDLREYVRLQGQASGGTRKLSGLISFTSAGSNVDALALPTSKYVTETWEQDGAKLLQLMERALNDTKNEAVSGLLTHQTHVSVTVYNSHLLLKIRGEKGAFPRIIEQVCWVLSAAGKTSISLLERYARETKGGRTTRGYSETLHTGKPVITAEPNGRFNVAFSSPRAENHGFVAETGHCWKTMTGLSIVASGYAIPQRPKQGSGLEAPLFVLRQLFRRGCPGKPVLPLDKPIVMIPTKVGKDDDAYQLRLIMAVGAQQQSQGNCIYWHFDPARICNSMGSCEQLEKEILTSPSVIKSRSRHFVGWSSEAGFLAGTPKTNIEVLDSKLLFLPHYELVVSSASACLRIPPIFNITAGIGREKVGTVLPTDNMSSSRSSARTILRFHYFVLWDTQDDRGWLLNGQAVALHLLRAHLKYRAETKNYDFSKLKNIGDETPSAAEKLLLELEDDKIPRPESSKSSGENSEHVNPSKDREENKDYSIGEVLDGIYAVLLKMRETTDTMYDHPNLTGSLRSWIDTRWSFTARGWDFEELAQGTGADVRVHKFHKDPGWYPFTKELRASFLFGGDFGEIMRPSAGHCCPHFQTLPKHQNFLAVGMHTIHTLVNKQGAAREPLETVAKLTQRDAWEHDVDPFNHSHGQGYHLDKVDSSCFPVQSLVRIRNNGNDKQKDIDLVKKSKGRLYSWIEVDKMNTTPEDMKKERKDRSLKTGVIVFGNKPDAAKLRHLAQSSSQRNGSSGGPRPASATPTPTSKQQAQVGATQRPASSKSLRSNTSTSDVNGVRNPTRDPSQLPFAPAGKASSVSSVRSTDSGTQLKAPGSSAGNERPQQSSPQTSTASGHRTPSISSVRSTASSTHPKAPSTTKGVGQPQTSSPQIVASATPKMASNDSLRSTGSRARPQPTVAGSGRPGESTAEPKVSTAARKLSSSSVRTTSSIDSKATGGSQPQIPAVQPASLSLKKTSTHSSDKTTSSRSSRGTQNSTAGSTAADSRRRQQRQDPIGAFTAGTGVTESHHPTSSGLAPAAGSGPDGTS